MLQHIEGLVDRIPEYDRKRREHFWIAPVAFRVADPAAVMAGESLLMDKENLVHGGHIGCFHCEEPWSQYLAARACTGNP
jgi:hypothetical protein